MSSFPPDGYTIRSALRVGTLAQSFVAERGAGAGSVELVLKQLLPAFAAQARVRERWVEKARENMAWSDPGSVRVLDARDTGEDAWLAVEHLPGKGLDVLLRAARQTHTLFPVEVATYIARESLATLTRALALPSPLLHLDLAPESVVIRADGSVVLTELGMFEALQPAEAARARFERGRVQCISPELAQSRPSDARSDVFSLGAVLFTMLAGEPPFLGATQLVIALNVGSGQRKTLAELRPDLPPLLCEVVEAMLAHAPEQRFQSARAALGALDEVAQASPEAAAQLAALMEALERTAHDVPRSPPPSSGQTREHARSRPASEPKTRIAGSFAEIARAVPRPSAAHEPPARTEPTVASARPARPPAEVRTEAFDMARRRRGEGAGEASPPSVVPPSSASDSPPARVTPASPSPQVPGPLGAIPTEPPMLVTQSPASAMPPSVSSGAPPALAPPPLVAPPPMLAPSSMNGPPHSAGPGRGGDEARSSSFFRRTDMRKAVPSPVPAPPQPLPATSGTGPPQPAASTPPFAAAAFAAPPAHGPPPSFAQFGEPRAPLPSDLRSRAEPRASTESRGARSQPPERAAPGGLVSPAGGAELHALGPALPDEGYREPSRTLFQAKSYAGPTSGAKKEKTPLWLLVTLAIVFGFALMAAGALVLRLLR